MSGRSRSKAHGDSPRGARCRRAPARPWAEHLCLWHLRLRGYRVLARRYRTPVGEIDLIARRGRIARALEHFLKSRPDLGDAELRFDVMLVAPGRWPRHLRNAWRVGE